MLLLVLALQGANLVRATEHFEVNLQAIIRVQLGDPSAVVRQTSFAVLPGGNFRIIGYPEPFEGTVGFGVELGPEPNFQVLDFKLFVPLSPETWSVPKAISPSGQWVVGSSKVPVKWDWDDPNTTVDLGVRNPQPQPGDAPGYAFSVTDVPEVFGSAEGLATAFFWSQATGIKWLPLPDGVTVVGARGYGQLSDNRMANGNDAYAAHGLFWEIGADGTAELPVSQLDGPTSPTTMGVGALALSRNGQFSAGQVVTSEAAAVGLWNGMTLVPVYNGDSQDPSALCVGFGLSVNNDGIFVGADSPVTINANGNSATIGYPQLDGKTRGYNLRNWYIANFGVDVKGIRQGIGFCRRNGFAYVVTNGASVLYDEAGFLLVFEDTVFGLTSGTPTPTPTPTPTATETPTPSPTPSVTPTPSPTPINNSAPTVEDIGDIIIGRATPMPDADLDHNGRIDVADVVIAAQMAEQARMLRHIQQMHARK